jgi:hypothetical protein
MKKLVVLIFMLVLIAQPVHAFKIGNDFEWKITLLTERYTHQEEDSYSAKTKEWTYAPDYRVSLKGYTKYGKLQLSHASWFETRDTFDRITGFQISESLSYPLIEKTGFKLSPDITFVKTMNKVETYRAGFRIEF